MGMWSLDNRTRHRVGKTWGRTKDGVHEWIVCVKGTYDIEPSRGSVSLSDEQVEPLRLPVYLAEPGASSLRYDADLVAPKPVTDIVLNGTAYSPGGRPSTDFIVTMSVGPVQKSIRVRGNRRWSDGPFATQPSRPEPLSRVPITYERAYGGYDNRDPDVRRHIMDPRNPVGCGVSRPEHRAGQPLPNFECVSGDSESSGPAGFGPIDSFWSPRREYTGTFDQGWEENRRPLLPVDWDPRSLLCSPRDQLPSTFLQGGEHVELINLTPNGRLQFVLPRVFFVFTTLVDGRREEHRGRLSTVIIEPDYPRVIMVWLTAMLWPGDIEYLDKTIVREKAFVR